MGHYESLLSKLDAFIRKYYKNQLIRGAVITFTALTAGWLVFSGVEYFGHFDSLVRTSLFWSFMAAASLSL
ncbi:MAG: hypothetical protein ACKPAD_13880, partial [Bacteroidota bacterium]